MTLRRATTADIDAIMEIERQPGYEDVVGRSARSIHEELIDDPGHAYLLGLGEDRAIRGFAILRGIGDPMGGVYLKRIAVRDPGRGEGSAMLESVVDWAFALGDCHRFHLDHFVTNARARRAYEKCGLRHEGVLREAFRLPDGRFADLAVMGITRPEWALRRYQEKREAAIAALSPLQRKLRVKSLDAVGAERRRLFAALGPDGVAGAERDTMFRLWSAVTLLHPRAHHVHEVKSCSRDAGLAELVRSLASDLARDASVDLVFSHSIAEPAGAIDWYERFAGAFDCDLEKTIDILDTLDRAKSRLFRDEVAIAAKDRRWAIWIMPDAVIRTGPGR